MQCKGPPKKRGGVLVVAGWDEILREIQTTPGNFDVVRRKYIHNLAKLTNRNVIAYYSGFLTKATAPNTDINDGDMSDS